MSTLQLQLHHMKRQRVCERACVRVYATRVTACEQAAWLVLACDVALSQTHNLYVCQHGAAAISTVPAAASLLTSCERLSAPR